MEQRAAATGPVQTVAEVNSDLSVQLEDVRNNVYLGFNNAAVSRHRFATVTEQIELLIFYPPASDAAQNKCHVNCGNKWAEGEVISHLLSHNLCANASQWRSDGRLMQMKRAAAVKRSVWMDDLMFHKVGSEENTEAQIWQQKETQNTKRHKMTTRDTKWVQRNTK